MPSFAITIPENVRGPNVSEVLYNGATSIGLGHETALGTQHAISDLNIGWRPAAVRISSLLANKDFFEMIRNYGVSHLSRPIVTFFIRSGLDRPEKEKERKALVSILAQKSTHRAIGNANVADHNLLDKILDGFERGIDIKLVIRNLVRPEVERALQAYGDGWNGCDVRRFFYHLAFSNPTQEGFDSILKVFADEKVRAIVSFWKPGHSIIGNTINSRVEILKHIIENSNNRRRMSLVLRTLQLARPSLNQSGGHDCGVYCDCD